jgi:hypothetical protein
MLTRRRRALLLTLAIVGVAFVVATAIVWRRWPADVMVGEAETRLAAITGLEARVSGVEVNDDGLVLRDVVLGGSEQGLGIWIDEAIAEAGLAEAALSGADAIESVRLRGVRVRVDLSRAGAGGLSALRNRFGGRSGADSGAAEAANGNGTGALAVDIADLELVVEDEAGELLVLRQGRVRREGDRIEAQAAAVRVGEGTGGSGAGALLEGVSFSARSGRLGLVVHGAEVDDAELRVAGFSVATAEAEEAAGPERWQGLLGRFRDALGLVRGAADEEPAPAASGGDEAHGTGLLAPDARVTIRSLDLRTAQFDERATLLEDFALRVEPADDGHIVGQGAGTVGDSGRAEVDLRYDPSVRRLQVDFANLPLAAIADFGPALPWHEPERTRLRGEVIVARDEQPGFPLEVQLAVSDLGLASERLSERPVEGIDLEVRLDGRLEPSVPRIVIDSGQVMRGEAGLALAGMLELSEDHYLVDLSVRLPPTRCDVAVGALPRRLLGELVAFDWEGRLSGRLDLLVDSRQLEETILEIDVDDACRFEEVPAEVDLRRFDRAFLHEAVGTGGEPVRIRTGPGTEQWTPLAEVSPFLVHAVLAHEDAAFLRHEGFAPWAIRNSLVRNLEEGRYVRGASTITMQLAKNLFLSREKTIARKVREALLTWWLESTLSKRDILELYLNVIEFGPDVYGIREAARHYFGRLPAELSPAESAFLASVLPAPTTYHRSYERGELTPAMRSRVRYLLRHMREKGRIDEVALEHGLSELDELEFHRGEQLVASPRVIPGGTEDLPFETARSVWDRWFRAGAAPDAGAAEVPPDEQPDAR